MSFVLKMVGDSSPEGTAEEGFTSREDAVEAARLTSLLTGVELVVIEKDVPADEDSNRELLDGLRGAAAMSALIEEGMASTELDGETQSIEEGA